MPVNISIEGGQTIGAPADWNAERDGPCIALQAAVSERIGGKAFTSAYDFTYAERQAIAENGGRLFLQILAPAHPVISMWVQDEGNSPIGWGIEFVTSDPVTAAQNAPTDLLTLLDFGFGAMIEELDLQAEQRSNSPEIGEPDVIGQVFVKGVFNLRAALEAAIEAMAAAEKMRANAKPPETMVVNVPIKTLGQVAIEALAANALKPIGEE